MDNHLLTERMVAYFAEYLNQLQDQTVKPDAPTSSKGEEAAPILEVPEYKGPLGTAGEEAAPILDVPEYKGPLGTAGEEAVVNEVPEYKGGANAVEAAVNEVPEYKGGANAVEALVHELPEYKGGANAVEALVHELPEYKGGVNAVEALVNEKPAYTGLLATAGDQAAPTIEKPEYRISQLGQGKLAESKTSVSTENHKRLPETGESQSDTAIFIASISIALSAAILATKRKEN